MRSPGSDRDPTLAGAPVPPGIQGVAIDPFDPYRTWNQKRQSEHEHAKQTMEALRTYAMAHQVHLWLVAPPAPLVDLRPPEADRKIIAEQLKSGIVSWGDLSLEEMRQAIAPLPPPQPPMWTGWAGAKVFLTAVAPPESK